MCIKFEHSHILILGFFPNEALNYASIRNHVSTMAVGYARMSP